MSNTKLTDARWHYHMEDAICTERAENIPHQDGYTQSLQRTHLTVCAFQNNRKSGVDVSE